MTEADEIAQLKAERDEAQAMREHFEERMMVRCKEVGELRARLSEAQSDAAVQAGIAKNAGLMVDRLRAQLSEADRREAEAVLVANQLRAQLAAQAGEIAKLRAALMEERRHRPPRAQVMMERPDGVLEVLQIIRAGGDGQGHVFVVAPCAALAAGAEGAT